MINEAMNDATGPEAIQENTLDDEGFEKYLDKLYMGEENNLIFSSEVDDEHPTTFADHDVVGFPPYLFDVCSTVGTDDILRATSIGANCPNIACNTSPQGSIAGTYHGADEQTHQIPKVDALNNAYVWIVHTNGIHHLAMVSCVCHGSHLLPMDLVACQLVPASLIKIHTLFSAQLMDAFCLSNLKLKAST